MMNENKNNKLPLYIPYAGQSLLEAPLLNKGSAFTEQERSSFNLTGLLPLLAETIEEQSRRVYQQYCSFHGALDKHIYLRRLQDTNETLFYYLVEKYIDEMMPIIYTPTVGDACEQFSSIYRCARGGVISYEQRHHIDEILHNCSQKKVKVIVVTDGERVLGLGDQGLGGMGIPIGKLSLYTACGGISPAYTLPIMLDVGTNNQKLLDDPMYMGVRHKRIAQVKYEELLDLFIKAIKRRWPKVLLQFEDFAQPNAMPLLQRYREEICCFNDDIQGTAAVTVGTLLAACHNKGVKLSQLNVVFVGAGSAGCGIAEQIIKQMIKEGATSHQARSQVYMVDRLGLLTQGMNGLRDFQEKLAQPKSSQHGWNITDKYASLFEVVHEVKPEILIGVSGQTGLFSESVIKEMKQYCDMPIIFPLSNPSSQVEATPEQLLTWTDGQAIIATGSPFAPVTYNGRRHEISQCNNSYIFPGLGLAVIACNISTISDEMLMKASDVLAEYSQTFSRNNSQLLPPLKDIANLSKLIAFSVSKVAFAQGYALSLDDDELLTAIDTNFWIPEYRNYRRTTI